MAETEEGGGYDVYDVYDVCERLDSIEQSISSMEQAVVKAGENNVSNRWSIGWLLVCLVLNPFSILSNLSRTIFQSKIRYAIQYGIGTDQVTIDPVGHDCAFLMPPIGEKYCHHEPDVTYVAQA